MKSLQQYKQYVLHEPMDASFSMKNSQPFSQIMYVVVYQSIHTRFYLAH